LSEFSHTIITMLVITKFDCKYNINFKNVSYWLKLTIDLKENKKERMKKQLYNIWIIFWLFTLWILIAHFAKHDIILKVPICVRLSLWNLRMKKATTKIKHNLNLKIPEIMQSKTKFKDMHYKMYNIKCSIIKIIS